MKLQILLFSCFLSLTAGAQTATEIVQKADEKMRGNTSQATLTIQIIRPSWTREMSVKTWMKNTDRAVILIQSPARDKGIVYLKRKNEVWNWIPSLEKVIKLPPSMMSQSWMGTDFSNDDLVKESSMVKDYDHRLTGDTQISDRPCYRIEMIPRAEAAVVWGKLVACIDKKDFMELHTEFYEENGTLVSTLRAGDPRVMDGRLIPTRFEMTPADKPGHKTVMIYKSIVYNKPIEDGFFTTERIKTIGN
ncbi:MAG: outer membrane lipoprotein-sorting protein [Chitinophagaceae bacterium]|nr:outer membrane lipoprotein-sorting protein [Chitinophagaceae bacterium]